MALYIGIMSGTSLDCIDVALVDFNDESGFPPPWELRHFVAVPFDQQIRTRMLAASSGEMSVRDLFRLDSELGVAYAETTLLVLEEAGVEPDEVVAVGLHGQTIWHAPKNEPVGVSAQIGSPAIVSERTGIPVIHDFRTADVAAGGEGAPLVPVFDHLYLRPEKGDRILVNIGGIANLTWLPTSATAGEENDHWERILAFDTGPGNVLIDAAMRQLFEREYDDGGRIANSGTVDQTLLDELLSERWLEFSPPKSTGRELFGEERGKSIVESATERGCSPDTIVATLTEYTAATIVNAIDQFCRGAGSGTEIVIGGGGAANGSLMKRIAERAGTERSVISSDDLGVPSEAKEAICFALLAWLNRAGRPGNVPSVTGASGARVLGSYRAPRTIS